MNFSPRLKKIIPYLILIIFGFLLYSQTLFFSFVYLDDNNLVLDHQQIFREANLLKIFTSDVFFLGSDKGFYYRPLLTLSFYLDSLIAGINPVIYHLTNIIYHLLAVCLVFLIFKKHFFSKSSSLFLAFIFLCHPVLTQAVAWIPGRNDSLLAIFILSSFYLFLNFLKTDKLKYLWGHLVFFVLALFTKETAAILPLVIMIYYFLFDYKFSQENKSNNFLICFSLWFGALLIWFLFRKISLPLDRNLVGMLGVARENISAIFVYFGKALLPFNLGVYPTSKDNSLYWGIISTGMFLLGLYLNQKLNWRRLLFGFLWFGIFLFPSLLNSDPALEHRLYLPLIGLLICLPELYPFCSLSWNNKFVKIAAAFLILFISVLTFFHSFHFSNRLSFWNEAVVNSPNSAFVHNNLGAMYYLDNNLVKAEQRFREALRLDPKQNLVHNNLGLIAAQAKKYSEAESEYKQELAIDPYYDNAWYNLGILYFDLKMMSEARAAFSEAYRLNPNNLAAYNNLLIITSN